MPSRAGFWALWEFQPETRQGSDIIEVWKFLVAAAPSTSRFREAGAAKLPGGASFNFDEQTREVSRRTGSGAAKKALGLEGPTERVKVESLGAEVFETRQFHFSLAPEPAKGQPGKACQREGKVLRQCFPVL